MPITLNDLQACSCLAPTTPFAPFSPCSRDVATIPRIVIYRARATSAAPQCSFLQTFLAAQWCFLPQSHHQNHPLDHHRHHPHLGMASVRFDGKTSSTSMARSTIPTTKKRRRTHCHTTVMSWNCKRSLEQNFLTPEDRLTDGMALVSCINIANHSTTA